MGEIEADLLFRGVDVHDWHTGKMSSRRLLILLEHLPDDSAFKMALNQDWPRTDQLATGMWNEIKAMRGDLWAFLGHEHLPFRPVLSPAAQRDQDTKQARYRAAHDEVIAQLRG